MRLLAFLLAGLLTVSVASAATFSASITPSDDLTDVYLLGFADAAFAVALPDAPGGTTSNLAATYNNLDISQYDALQAGIDFYSVVGIYGGGTGVYVSVDNISGFSLIINQATFSDAFSNSPLTESGLETALANGDITSLDSFISSFLGEQYNGHTLLSLSSDHLGQPGAPETLVKFSNATLGGSVQGSVDLSSAPEPGTWALLLAGLALVPVAHRRLR